MIIAMNNVINSCSFINGMDIKLFANELQEYLGVNHVFLAEMGLMLSNCSNGIGVRGER